MGKADFSDGFERDAAASITEPDRPAVALRLEMKRHAAVCPKTAPVYYKSNKYY